MQLGGLAAPKAGGIQLGGLGAAAPKAGGIQLGGAAPKVGGGIQLGGAAAPKAGGIQLGGAAAPKAGGIQLGGAAAPKAGGIQLGGAVPKAGGIQLGGAAPKAAGVQLGGAAPKAGANLQLGGGAGLAAPKAGAQVGLAGQAGAAAGNNAAQPGAAATPLSGAAAAPAPAPRPRPKKQKQSRGKWGDLLESAQRLGEHKFEHAGNFVFEARDPMQLAEHASQLRQRTSIHSQAGARDDREVPFSAFGGLGGGLGAADIAAHTRAHALLATKGFDAERLGRKVERVNLKSKYEPREARAEADLEGFLRDEHDAIVLSTIAETRKETAERFERAQEELIMEDWEECKRIVISQLQGRLPVGLTPGVGPRRNEGPALRGNDPSQQLLEDMLGQPALAPIGGLAGQYAGVVESLHAHVLRKEPFRIISSLAGATIAAETGRDLAHARDAARVEGLRQIWDMLCDMLGESETPPAAGVYLAEWNGSAEDKAGVTARLLQGAQSFLESQYEDYIKNTIRENPEVARVGPSPNETAWYGGFLRVLYQNGWPDDLVVVSDVPIWACVFLCLRCGGAERALDALLSEIESAGGESALGNFAAYARLYADPHHDGFDGSQGRHILHDYEQLAASSATDPFQLLCYNIIANDIVVDVDSRRSFSDLLTTTQDFMWYHILQIRGGGLRSILDEENGSAPTLLQFQELLRQYGADHFSVGGQRPLLYFEVLLLSCQFDQAISWLSGLPQYHAEAAHVALALYHYGICEAHAKTNMGTRSFHEDSFDGAGVLERSFLAYAMALASPARGIASTEHALQYISLIRDPTRRGRALAQVLVQGDSDTLSTVLGDPAQGTRGIFETLGLEQEEIKDVLRLAAGSHEITGRHTDAVRVFEYAGDAVRVWEVLTAQLSRLLADPPSDNSERESIADLAMQIYQKHRDEEVPNQVAEETGDPTAVRSAWLTLELALNLVFFFDLYHANQPDRAIQLMEELDLLPLRGRGEVVDLQFKLDQFKTLDHAIRRNVGNVLVATMDSLRMLLLAQRERYPADPADAENAELVREQAKAVLSFSGLLAQRLPDDLQARLMRLWVGMA